MLLDDYQREYEARKVLEIPPLPLQAEQVSELIALLKDPPKDSEALLIHLLEQCIPPGVDPAAFVKAAFLADVAKGETQSPLVSRLRATELLGTMLGGYNIQPLIELLDDDEVGDCAVDGLSRCLLMFDAFHDVIEKSQHCQRAQSVLQSWADGEWFLARPELPESIRMAVFKIDGEVNTDDLSPGQEAWSRPDIPLHARSMLQSRYQGDALAELSELLQAHQHVAFASDVLGTGSSRKSAINSILWHTGSDIPWIPNKREGGFCLGTKIAPIFFNTMEDAGALPIECDTGMLKTGMLIDIHPYRGEISDADGKLLSSFVLKSEVLLDSVRAGGRIRLIIGRGLTARTREALGLPPSELFRQPEQPQDSGKGFTLAQKMVGRACGLPGVRPHSYCEPRMSTVGSQDTTGPMTRDELKELACLGFSADLTMQSFCHTAAYPKPVDIETQHSLPDFIINRGGVSLRPGDGIIHSWLNRMLLPDEVGTGGDSHTRFPIGISFPAGSGLVAFAAAMGVMPLDMPESVLVRFHGEMQQGITLRDLVNAIPYAAIQRGLLTVPPQNKQNIFSGRCLEVEGLPLLKVEQAFEISDASAERSASGCTIRLDEAPIVEYLSSNITLLRWMIDNDYGDARTLERRVRAMEAWVANPVLLQPDADAEYTEILDIDLNEIREPLLACPNNPDDIKPLSSVQGDPIDEVFIGSCMTNIGHFRATARLLEKVEQLGSKLWIAPPTRMDQHQLNQEGVYSTFGAVGARTEIPGCSLCMGNQARVANGARVVSTSTRNYPNRLGDGASVYLSSAELAAVTAVLGQLPSPEEYQTYMKDIDAMSGDIYRYLNFNEMQSYRDAAENARINAVNLVIEDAT